MKIKNIKIIEYFFIIIISVIYPVILLAQSPTDLLYLEPEFTTGTSNDLIILNKSNGFIFFYIVGPDDKKYKIDDLAGVIASAHHYPPGRNNPPLKNNEQYRYFFQISDNADGSNPKSTSNTVSSIQDTSPPDLIYCRAADPLIDNIWLNKRTFNINYNIKDNAGVQYVYLYQRKKGERSWSSSYNDLKEYYIQKNVKDGYAHKTDITDSYIINVNEDGHYEYYITAKDASHAPISCENEWILAGNESKTNPDLNHLAISIDATLPHINYDDFKTFQNTLTIIIPYKANDPKSGSDSIASGLDVVSLYQIVNDKEVFLKNRPYSSVQNSIEGNFEIPVQQEGIYLFILQAMDHAGNVYETNFINITVDITPPKIQNFQINDPTIVDTDKYTKAESGWTNDLEVNGKLNAEDILSGLDSMIFTGDLEKIIINGQLYPKDVWIPYNADFIIVLNSGDGVKNISCKVKDKAGNESQFSISQIILDTIAPELLSIILYDFDKRNPLETNELQVIVIVKKAQASDITISHIHLYQDPISDSGARIWQKFIDGGEYVYHCADDAGPCSLLVRAIVRDYAGNIKQTIWSDDIYYDPFLEIIDLDLQDKDGEVVTPDKRKFTNDLEIHVFFKSSRIVNSSFELQYSRDLNFSEFQTVQQPHFKTTDKPNLWKVLIDLQKIGYDNTNEKKDVYIRLVDGSSGKISDPEYDTIFLDTTSPELITPGFKLLDATEEEILPLTWMAQVGWTKEADVKFETGTWKDKDAGLKKYKFYGDLEAIIEYDINNLPSTLKLKYVQNKNPYIVKMSACDALGNWSDLIKNPIIDQASIFLDNLKPDISISWPTIKPILQCSSITVNLSVEEHPFRSYLNRVCVWKYGLESPPGKCVNTPDQSSTDVKIPIQISGITGSLKICAVAIDNAGNADSCSQRIFIEPGTLVLNPILFDIQDSIDSQFSKSLTVGVNLQNYSPAGENIEYYRFDEDSVTLKSNNNNWMKYPQSGETAFRFSGNDLNKKYTLFAQLKNEDGIPSKIASCSIIVDRLPPILYSITIKDADNKSADFTDQPKVLVEYKGVDTAPGQLKSIKLSSSQDFTSSTDISIDTIITFDLGDKVGNKTIWAKLVDQAENESNIVFDFIGFSDKNPILNTPNPFKPPEKTNIIIPNPPMSWDVELKIYDVFGNLVLLDHKRAEMGQQWEYTWDGKNGMGLDVAEGVYLAIAQFKRDVTYKTKIGVVRH